MATSLTRFLKLRVDSGLTANSKYNLERIDTLAAGLSTDTAGITNLRSSSDITIEPEAAAVGGSGSGGTVNIGTTGHTLSEIRLRASSVFVTGLGNTHVVTTTAAGALTSVAALGISNGGTGQTTANAALNALLPTQTGQFGKLLTTDGTNSSWHAVNITDTVTAYEADWLPADGATKLVPHNLGNSDVVVAIRDTADGQQIVVDIQATNDNNVLLTSSEVPTSTWRVTVQAGS